MSKEAVDVREPWFYSEVVEHIPTMVFVKDENLKFVLFNRSGRDLLGLDREGLIGKSDEDFFPKEQADFFHARDRETLAQKKVVAVEEPIDTKEGRRYLYTKKIPILDPDGHPKYLLGVSLDITDRKAMEDELKLVNTRAREALEHVMALEPLAEAGGRAAEAATRIVALLEQSSSTDPKVAEALALARDLLMSVG